MSRFSRFAIFHVPPAGALADRAAAWLGWNPETARDIAQPSLDGLPDTAERLTRQPRQYGFHATFRAPFRPAAGLDQAALRRETAALATRLAPVALEGMTVAALGRFLALRPVGDTTAIRDLASAIVRETNGWRAEMTGPERTRRAPENLSPGQRDLLERWGYPFVHDEFRFHMTLTGPLDAALIDRTGGVLSAYFNPVIPVPYPVSDLCLVGERQGGRFEIVARYPLCG